MRFTQSLLAASLAGLTTATYGPRLSSRQDTADTAPAVTDKFIVEIAQGVDYDAAVKEIGSRPGVKVTKQLRSAIFNGISVEATKSNSESLEQLPQIARAWRSQAIKLEENMAMSTASDLDGVEAANYSTHSMTGVDQVHAAGVFGKGVKVAVIDTGADYNHPVLGGGFGPGHKVAGGYDLVGDGNWPNVPPTPDDDPIDQIGRGTHACGIVAGKHGWYTGVAPEATILAYKVFSRNDYTDDWTMIQAFIKAYEDGADIITATFGAAYDGWSNGALATIANRIVDEGIIVTIAAGDSGLWGPFRPSSGAIGENVLSVAAAEPTVMTGLPVLVNVTDPKTGESKTITIAYRPGNTWTGSLRFNSTMPPTSVVPFSLDLTIEDAACAPLPSTSDFSGKIVLVRASSQCRSTVQINNIAPHNPLGILIYHNPATTFMNPLVEFYEGGTGIIIADAGKWMIEALANGSEVLVDFSQQDDRWVEMPYAGKGGTPSPYTAWGGTWDLQLKPDISAPGNLIMGAWLDNRYMVVSGTFSSAPYVAGVAALYLSKHGGRSVHGKGIAHMVHARIASSGAAMPSNDAWRGEGGDGGQHLSSPAQVGTGLIDAVKVMGFTTQLSFERFNLNDTRHFSRYHGVDITNNGDEEVEYSFDVQDAGGFDAFNSTPANGAPPRMNSLVSMYKLKPEVRFPAGTFRVKPGQTKKAEFIFKMPELPAGHISANLPIVSGKILINSSNGEQLSVPYFGMVSDLKKELRQSGMWGRPSSLFPRGADIVTGRTTNGQLLRIKDKPYWGFNTSSEVQDYPLLNAMLVYGSRELRWDIYEAGWKERKWQYPPVVGQNGFIGSVSYWRNSQSLAQGRPLPPGSDLDDVVPTPAQFLNRDASHMLAWFGHLNNGSMIAPGNYTMRLAALLPFGNREASDNWDVAELPEIMILPRGQ